MEADSPWESSWVNLEEINGIIPSLSEITDKPEMEEELESISSIYTEDSIRHDALHLSSIAPSALKSHLEMFTGISIGVWRRAENPPYTLNLIINQSEIIEKKILFLSIVEIDILLHSAYPAVHPPLFRLRSDWIPQITLEEIGGKLNELWRETKTEILFEWVDYLQNTLPDSHLSYISQNIISLPEDQFYTLRMDRMMNFNNNKYKQEFNYSEHTCPICYVDSPGINFIILNMCKHYFCKMCITEFIENSIHHSQISSIRCPNYECKKPINPKQIKEFVSPEMGIKYDKFSVRTALEGREGVFWCPRCEGPAFREEFSIGAICSICELLFCSLCMSKYHPFVKCGSMIEKYKSKKVNIRIDKDLIPEELKHEIESDYMIKKYTKKCPGCGVSINKQGGCNKVVCKCGGYMCWLCTQAIAGYDHFGKGCQLFTEEDLNERNMPDVQFDLIKDELDKQIVVSAIRTFIKCPQCTGFAIKSKDINLVKCNQCQITYCATCGLKGDETHFTNYPCLKY